MKKNMLPYLVNSFVTEFTEQEVSNGEGPTARIVEDWLTIHEDNAIGKHQNTQN